MFENDQCDPLTLFANPCRKGWDRRELKHDIAGLLVIGNGEVIDVQSRNLGAQLKRIVRPVRIVRIVIADGETIAGKTLILGEALQLIDGRGQGCRGRLELEKEGVVAVKA